MIPPIPSHQPLGANHKSSLYLQVGVVPPGIPPPGAVQWLRPSEVSRGDQAVLMSGDVPGGGGPIVAGQVSQEYYYSTGLKFFYSNSIYSPSIYTIYIASCGCVLGPAYRFFPHQTLSMFLDPWSCGLGLASCVCVFFKSNSIHTAHGAVYRAQLKPLKWDHTAVVEMKPLELGSESDLGLCTVSSAV